MEQSKTNVKLYSEGQVGALTFLAGPLAGLYTLHSNFKALGKLEEARSFLLKGGIGCALFFVFVLFLPEGTPGFILPLLIAMGARQYFVANQASEVDEAFAVGAKRQSGGKAFLVFLLSLLTAVVFIFVLAFTLAALL